MNQLNFKPFQYSFQFKTEKQKTYIFDRVRKKYIHLTPEEWVRQHVISFLHEEKGCSLGLFSIEKGLKYQGLQKRYDLCVFDNAMQLLLLVECKAPGIKLNEETFLQSLTYAQVKKPKYIMLTNGIQHIFYEVASKRFLEDIELCEK